MSSTEEIRSQLVEILARHDLLDRDGKLATPDSMAMVLLSVEIENRWARFPEDCIKVSNFVSIERLVSLIETLIERRSSGT